MNTYFFIAACLVFILGLTHSVLGEILIFRRLRKDSFIPTIGGKILKERHVRILWATWHLTSILGWGFAAILLQLSFPAPQNILQESIETAILFSMLSGAVLVLIGTKGKHPGWIVLLAIAIFLWLG